MTQNSKKELDAYFTAETEEIFIEFALSDSKLYEECRKGFDPQLFKHKDNQRQIRFINDYFKKHQHVPNKAIVSSSLGLARIGHPEFPAADLMDKLDWFKAEFAEFYQYKTMQDALVETYHEHEEGDFAAVHDRWEKLRDNSLFVVDTSRNLADHMPWFADVLQYDTENYISTGWGCLDKKIGGGMGRKQIMLYVGGSGRGKSIALGNSALHMAKAGQKVLFVTAEMTDGDIMKRFAVMATGKILKPHASPEEINDYCNAVKRIKWWGNLKVDYMGSPTAASVEAKVQYHANKGWKPDAVVIDYLDLCLPNAKKLHGESIWVRDEAMALEMTAVAMRQEIALVSACQTNTNTKDRKPGELYDQAQMAGGQSKYRLATNVVFIERIDNTAERKKVAAAIEDGDADQSDMPEFAITGYKYYPAKTRHGAGCGFIEMGWNKEWLTITDLNAPAPRVFAEDGDSKPDFDPTKRLNEMIQNNKKRKK